MNNNAADKDIAVDDMKFDGGMLSEPPKQKKKNFANLRDILKRISHVDGKKIHKKKYNPMIIERVHPLFGCCSFCGFAFFAVFFMVMAFIICPGDIYTTRSITFQDAILTQIVNGNTKMTINLPNLAAHNQEVYVSMYFQTPGAAEYGIFKRDLSYTFEAKGIYERGEATGNEVLYDNTDTRHVRTLVCPTKPPQTTTLSSKPIDCYPITIFHYTELGYYDTLQLQLTFTDRRLPILFEQNILYPSVRIDYTFMDNTYSLLSGALRGTLALVITLLFFVYVIVCVVVAAVRRANLKGEQKTFILAYFFLVLYNNPFYPMSLIVPIFIFPIINTVFLVTFVCMLIYLCLVISGSFVEREKHKRFKFYLPKIILVVAIWFLYSLMFLYYQLREKDDPSYDAYANATNFFQYVGIFSILLFLLFVFIIFYYQIRALGFWQRSQLPENMTFKFFNIAPFLSVLVVFSFVNAILYFMNSASTAMSMHPIFILGFFIFFNLIIVCMSIWYLPWPFGDQKITIPDFVFKILELPLRIIKGKKKTSLLDKMIEKEQDDDQRLLLESYEEFAAEQLNFVAEDDVNFDGTIEELAQQQLQFQQQQQQNNSPALNSEEIELEINQNNDLTRNDQKLNIPKNFNNIRKYNIPPPISTAKVEQQLAAAEKQENNNNSNNSSLQVPKPTPLSGNEEEYNDNPTPLGRPIDSPVSATPSSAMPNTNPLFGESQEQIIYASQSFFNKDLPQNEEINEMNNERNQENNNSNASNNDGFEEHDF